MKSFCYKVPPRCTFAWVLLRQIHKIQHSLVWSTGQTQVLFRPDCNIRPRWSTSGRPTRITAHTWHHHASKCIIKVHLWSDFRSQTRQNYLSIPKSLLYSMLSLSSQYSPSIVIIVCSISPSFLPRSNWTVLRWCHGRHPRRWFACSDHKASPLNLLHTWTLHLQSDQLRWMLKQSVNGVIVR